MPEELRRGSIGTAHHLLEQDEAFADLLCNLSCYKEIGDILGSFVLNSFGKSLIGIWKK